MLNVHQLTKQNVLHLCSGKLCSNKKEEATVCNCINASQKHYAVRYGGKHLPYAHEAKTRGLLV